MRLFILGFSSLVCSADQDAELRRKIVHALRQVSVVKGPIEGDKSYRAQNFSDCVIMTADNTASGLWRTLLAIRDLTWYLLEIGSCRGVGVTISNVHHDDEIAYGVGIVDAHELEKNVAVCPRVILDDKVIDACSALAEDDEIAEVC